MHPQQGFLAVGLQKLLLCFFIFVSIIPVLFLGSWVYNHALATELAAVEGKHLVLADSVSGTLSSYVNDLKAVFVAKSESHSQVISDESEALLRSVNIRMLGFIKPGGEMVYCLGDRTLLPADGLEALRLERRQALLHPQETIISRLVLNVNQVPMMYLLRLTRSDEMAIASVDTDYFKAIQRRIQFGEKGHSAIVDQSGQVIAHPDTKWEAIAKDLSDLKPMQLMKIEKRGIVEFYSPAVKAEMIAGYTIVPETGWGVMVPQPYREIEVAAHRTKSAALYVSVLGLLLATLVSWQLTRYILSPIESLIAASKALETGERVENLAVKQQLVPKEMYQLLRAFDHMAQEVSLVRMTLEQRVKARTHELRAEVERRKQLEVKLLQQATHDALTGLPNRRLLEEQLQSALASAERSEYASALFFLDLDGFKPINDTYGHHVGDELLIQVSKRLQASLRGSDSVFRIGGDEFVILIYQVESTEAVKRLSDKILMIVQQPFCVDGHVVSIGGSIGIRLSNSRHEESLEKLLAEADAAMYWAKEKGNCAIIYEEYAVS